MENDSTKNTNPESNTPAYTPVIRTVGAYYAKTHFSQLLDDVEDGNHFIITRNDRPVGRFIPAETDFITEKKRRTQLAMQKMLELTKGTSLGGGTIRQMIDEGRK